MPPLGARRRRRVRWSCAGQRRRARFRARPGTDRRGRWPGASRAAASARQCPLHRTCFAGLGRPPDRSYGPGPVGTCGRGALGRSPTPKRERARPRWGGTRREGGPGAGLGPQLPRPDAGRPGYGWPGCARRRARSVSFAPRATLRAWHQVEAWGGPTGRTRSAGQPRCRGDEAPPPPLERGYRRRPRLAARLARSGRPAGAPCPTERRRARCPGSWGPAVGVRNEAVVRHFEFFLERFVGTGAEMRAAPAHRESVSDVPAP